MIKNQIIIIVSWSTRSACAERSLSRRLLIDDLMFALQVAAHATGGLGDSLGVVHVSLASR